MWDHFSNRFPHRISDHSHGNVAVDFFHRYKVFSIFNLFGLLLIKVVSYNIEDL